MIDVADSSAVYYYHYDGLGSVVALSDSYGNSCQSYEYSAYGQVAASEEDFIPNPYMYTGRRFDYETGLYYYRARYYNPYIGRFLQTDPIGYGNGINWYAYCENNPLNFVDPSGLVAVSFYDPYDVLTMIDGSGIINGGFQEYADDFDHNYEMEDFSDVIAGLLDMRTKGIEVTEVYFYDHCLNDADQNVTGLQFGKSKYKFEGGELQKYMTLLGHLRDKGLLTEDATINFRHCFLGMEQNKSKLEDLAEWTKGNVTGVDGWILPSIHGRDSTREDQGKKMIDGVLVPWYFRVNEIAGVPDYAPYNPNIGNGWKQLTSYSNAIYNKKTQIATWEAGKSYKKKKQYGY